MVFVSTVASCILSCAAGAWITPLLPRLGADPATASGIFLTTATDVSSISMFAAMATALTR